MGLVVTNKNLPSAKAKSVVEVEVFTGTEFFGHKTEIIQDHTRLTNLNGDQEVQHINAKEKVAVQGITNKAFGYIMSGVKSVLIKNNIDFSATDFTFEFIFNKGSNSRDWLFFQPTTTGDYFGIQVRENNDIAIHQGIASISGIIKLNTDYHLLYCKTGNTFSVYVNGQKVSEAIKDNIVYPAANTDIVLAQYPSANQDLKMRLFRIYKRGFTQSDVDYYYNAGRPDLTRLSYEDKVNKTSTGCVLELLPENATASKWLDTQNGLDGITTGNPTIDYGNCTPEPYIYPFKKYIGLEKSGDGTGFARFSVITNKTGKATIKGGVFVNSTNTQELGNEVSLFKDVQTDIYVKLNSNIGELAIDNLIYISDFVKTVNSPILSVDTSELPIRTALLGDTGTLVNKLYGSVSLIPRDTIDLRLATPTSNNELTTGDYRELPRSVSYLYLNGTKIKGNFKNLPRKTDTTIIQNSTSESSGITRDIPDSRVFELYGMASISGDIGELIGTFSSLVLSTTNANITYSTGLKVLPAFSRLVLRPTTGVFTSAMTDKLIIDLASQITTAIGSKIIDLTGNCGAPTAASSDARAKLSGLGFTIMVN